MAVYLYPLSLSLFGPSFTCAPLQPPLYPLVYSDALRTYTQLLLLGRKRRESESLENTLSLLLPLPCLWCERGASLSPGSFSYLNWNLRWKRERERAFVRQSKREFLRISRAQAAAATLLDTGYLRRGFYLRSSIPLTLSLSLSVRDLNKCSPAANGDPSFHEARYPFTFFTHFRFFILFFFSFYLFLLTFSFLSTRR